MKVEIIKLERIKDIAIALCRYNNYGHIYYKVIEKDDFGTRLRSEELFDYDIALQQFIEKVNNKKSS